MKLRLLLALRNVFRNRRRSALNLFMIGSGVASVILFEGFARSLLQSLRDTTIRTQTGHVQVALKRYWEDAHGALGGRLLQGSEGLRSLISTSKRVAQVQGRLSFFGLAATADNSVSARGQSISDFDAEAFTYSQGAAPRVGSESFEGAVGAGLARRLRLKAGDRLTLMANTVDGVINAVDLHVTGLFQTGVSEFDDLTVLLSLGAAQTLLDTEEVEQLVVHLRSAEEVEPFLRKLNPLLPEGVQAKPWFEVAGLYRQLSSFHRVQNALIAGLILTLTVLAILNTVGMSVFERTAEIGTMRALGERDRWVVRQFLLEGAVLGAVGTLVGLVLGVGAALVVNALEIGIAMPGASQKLVVHIALHPVAFGFAGLLALAASVGATWLPAWRAGRMEIAQALRAQA